MRRCAYALLACLMLASVADAAERKLALVIGNSGYRDAPLLNPGNDARAISQVLREAGFTVMERRNVNQGAMRRVIREFGDELMKGGVGVFFYAGHAMQVRGRNYLIPVGHDIQREDEVADQSVDVGLVLEKMATARNALNILILDACRNNPFGGPAGLAPLDAPPGTLIAFATAPGQVADDGTGDNGLYTKHLVSYLREPGLKAEDMFKRVRAAVRQESGGKQVPWENTSLETDFYFRPADPKVIAAQEEERRQAQQAAIERAVQEALKRRSDQDAQERAKLEREIAERLATERVAAERAAQERAGLEREAAERVAAAQQASRDRSLAQQQEPQKAQKEAIDKAVQEAVRRAEERAAQERVKLEREMAERMAAERAAAQRAAQEQITAVERAVQERVAAAERAALAAIEQAAKQVAKVVSPSPQPAPAPQPAAETAAREEKSPAGEPPAKIALAAPDSAVIAASRAAILPKVGDAWSYKVTDRDYSIVKERQLTQIVQAVTDKEIHIKSGRKVFVRYNHQWNMVYLLGRDGMARTFEPFVPSHSFPLEPGKSWQGKYTLSRPDWKSQNDMSVTVAGWEEVKVPAGAFRALKLSGINWYRRLDNDFTGRIMTNVWYVPAVKRSVKYEVLQTGSNNVVLRDETWELMTYKLQ